MLSGIPNSKTVINNIIQIFYAQAIEVANGLATEVR